MKTFRVLLGESDEQTIKRMKKLFSLAGGHVEVRSDGTAALEWAAKEPPDLIVVSAELVGVNGYSVVNKLKKSETTMQIPVILTSKTATAETFKQHKKLRTAANAYLLVPFSDKQFRKAVCAAAPHLDLDKDLEPKDKSLRESEPTPSPVRCLACGHAIPLKSGWENNLTPETIDNWTAGLCPGCGSGMFTLN